uniref:Uncharacterized protein n=1 Tax=Cacopsylla melanoneura TaxID=428564 RepID=A0A8D8LWX6_9HEMI
MSAAMLSKCLSIQFGIGNTLLFDLSNKVACGTFKECLNVIFLPQICPCTASGVGSISLSLPSSRIMLAPSLNSSARSVRRGLIRSPNSNIMTVLVIISVTSVNNALIVWMQ